MPERENFMKLRSSKAAAYAGLAMVMFMMPIVPDVVEAKPTYEQQESTQLETQQNEKQASYTEYVADIVAKGYELSPETDMYYNMAVAVVEPYIEVYEQADETSQVVGRIYQSNIAEAVEIEDEWTKINSGNLTGFVSTSALCFNEEAAQLAGENGDVVVTVTAETADLYSSITAEAGVATAANGETFTAVGRCGDYIAVSYQEEKLYIISDLVSVDYGLSYGYTNEEVEAKEAAEAEAARLAAEEAARKAAEERKRKEQERIKAAMVSAKVTYNPTIEVSEEEVWLLACIIDWESNWEPYEGKLAVANVVLNRLRSGYYGDTIQDVVYAKGQFSGVLDSNGNVSTRFAARLKEGPRSSENMQAALEALSGKNNIGGFFSFRGVHIADFASYSQYTIIGSHCFF